MGKPSRSISWGSGLAAHGPTHDLGTRRGVKRAGRSAEAGLPDLRLPCAIACIAMALP